MKKLQLNQMENLEGGQNSRYKVDQAPPLPKESSDFLTGCSGASVALAFGFAGLVMGGASVIGAGIGAAAFIYTSAQWGAACS